MQVVFKHYDNNSELARIMTSDGYFTHVPRMNEQVGFTISGSNETSFWNVEGVYTLYATEGEKSCVRVVVFVTPARRFAHDMSTLQGEASQ